MNPRCAVAITQAAAKLGRAVTRAELNNIEAKVRDMSKGVRAKDPARWQGLSAGDRMKEVGVALSDEFKSQAIRKATNASRDMVIAAKNEAYMDAAATRGITGFRSLMHKLGFIADGKGGTFNAEFRAKAIANGHLELMRPLIDMDKKGSFFGLFSSEKGTLDVLREYEGISTGNADAMIAADSLRAAVESAMREFNAAGGDIRKLTNYRPQRQDQWKVYKAGRDKWVDDAMQNIDRRTLLDENGVMLDDAKARSFLQEAWWNLASDGLAKDRGGVGASAAISNRHKAHRQLNWKSPESFMAMQSKYGGGSFVDQVKGHIDGLAHETALMEQFGSNPLHQIDVLKEKAKKLDKDNGVDINKTISERNRFETMTDKFAGIDQGITGNVLVHKAFSVMKNLNIANKLGSILTSQLADNGTAIATARALNIPLKEWASMKAKGYTNDQLKNMAKSNGIAFDVMIDNLVRLGDSTDATGISGKLAQLTMKVSGANMFTAMHRTAFASLVESHVGSLTRKYDWNTLPAKDKAILEGKGIGEQDWNIYRLAEVDPESGLLGFSQINAVSSADIKQATASRTLKEAEALRREAHLKLTAYALEEAETAVMQPSLHSQSILPLHKGEVLSELGGAVSQFKSFAIGFMNQHMYQRAEMMGGTVNKYAYRLNLLAMTTVLGGVGLLLGDIAQGKDPRKIFDSNSDDPIKPTAKFAMQAMLKGGGLSVFGDLLNLFTEEGQRDPIEHMTGPMFGQIAKTLKTGQEIRKASVGDNSNVAKASLALAREFVPMNNLIWTRAVWNNYLMAELNEMASPGYMERIKGLAEKNYGTDYYAGMGNGLRAPNFGNIAGQ